MSKVSIVKCNSYNQEEVDRAVQKSIDLLGGLSSFIKSNDKVLIKPNILLGLPPESAAATHPAIVSAIIRLVKSLGIKPKVGDSPGFESLRKAAEGSGILKAIDEGGAEFREFNQAEEIEFKDGLVCKKMKIAKEVIAADIIINTAKLKTHNYTGLTAAVKNLFGCIPGLIKSQFHLQYCRKNDFELMLLDILKFVKPTLNIVDAVVAMEGMGGPTTGSPRKMNLIISGTDAISVDAVCAALTGKKPGDFNYLKLAEKHDRGETNLEKIEIKGEKLSENICKDFKHLSILGDEMLPAWIPKNIIPFMRGFLLDHPVLNQKKCIKCAVCFKVCPAKAITLKEGLPDFNYSACIGCYCCQEMCREKAINIKKSSIGRLILKLSSLIVSKR